APERLAVWLGHPGRGAVAAAAAGRNRWARAGGDPAHRTRNRPNARSVRQAPAGEDGAVRVGALSVTAMARRWGAGRVVEPVAKLRARVGAASAANRT